jgi:hypothetical protein
VSADSRVALDFFGKKNDGKNGSAQEIYNDFYYVYTVISYYIYTIQVLDGNNSIARLADYQMTRLYL